MIVEELQKLVLQATKFLKNEGFLNEIKDTLISFEHPENPEHGDYSTNVALVLAKGLNQNPRQLAEDIVSKLEIRNLSSLPSSSPTPPTSPQKYPRHLV